MLTLYAMLCIIYILTFTPSNHLKKLTECEKNSKQLEDEIKILKNTLEVILNLRVNEPIHLATSPNLNNSSRNLTSFQI
jgi:hypothetical protein